MLSGSVVAVVIRQHLSPPQSPPSSTYAPPLSTGWSPSAQTWASGCPPPRGRPYVIRARRCTAADSGNVTRTPHPHASAYRNSHFTVLVPRAPRCRYKYWWTDDSVTPIRSDTSRTVSPDRNRISCKIRENSPSAPTTRDVNASSSIPPMLTSRHYVSQDTPRL